MSTDVIERWKRVETKAIGNRVAKCNDTLTKLLGVKSSELSPTAPSPIALADSKKAPSLPRVAMAFSGGGWRAMTSAVAVMDALSIPLDPSETASNEEGIKLLDVVTHIMGLSGGSWAAFVTLAGGERNPFHHDPKDKAPIGPADRAAHPWLHGQKNKFDPNVHQHAGLKFMTDAAHVSQACYRGGKATRFVSLSANLADTTFGSALATRLLGTTLVERWSNFLANDILSFKDGGELKAPSTEAEERAAKAANSANNNSSAGNLSINDSDGGSAAPPATAAASKDAAAGEDRPQQIIASKEEVAAMADVAARDPNIGSKARSIKLSDLRPLIDSGDFPFVCNTAIANRKGIAASDDNTTRLYDWVEISPYFIRNIASGHFTDDVDSCGCYFLPPEAPVRPRSDMYLHNYMAVCGSAFACDVGALLPKGVCSTIRDSVKLKSSPILGGGLTDIIYGKEEGAPVCTCRDAGIDFNVPFPPLLQEAQRAFDIVIAMDAGADSTNAYELQRAVELGYLAIDRKLSPDPLEVFPEGNRVRVYRSLKGGPTIIYLLGLTKRPTNKIIHRPEQITRDTDAVRRTVMDELIPLLLSELRLVHANALVSAGLLGTAAAAETNNNNSALMRPVRYDSISSRINRLALAGGGVGTDDGAETSNTPQTPYGNAQPPAGTALVPQAYPALGGGGGGRGCGGFTSLAETIIASASGQGMIKDAIDAFFVVEKAVLASLPHQERRNATITVLEEEAISLAAGTNPYIGVSGTSLKERLAANGNDIVESLAQIGVVRKLHWADITRRNVELVPEWADFYIATSLVRHLLPAARHLSEDAVKNVLRVMGRQTVRNTSSPQHIELVFVRTRTFKTSSRLSTLLGSLASKLSKHNCDVSQLAAQVVTKRYLAQIEMVSDFIMKGGREEGKGTSEPFASAAATAAEPITPSAAADLMETTVMRMCDNVVDFFAEMLSFDYLNDTPEMSLTAWDLAVLGAFVTATRGIADGLAAAANQQRQQEGFVLGPTAHGLLLAEAIARHPSECSFALLRVMCEEKGAAASPKVLKMLPHLGAPSALNDDNKGLVRLAAVTPSVRPHPEDLLRILAAAYASPDGYAAKRSAIQNLFARMAKGGAAPNNNASDLLTMSLDVAYANCFAGAISYWVKSAPLDNLNAVRSILDCSTHYATMLRSKNKRDALHVVWAYGAETQEFRTRIATECLQRLELFDFVAPYCGTISVPAGTTPEKVDDVLAFAERNKDWVRKIVPPPNYSTEWSSTQRVRLDRVNSALLSAAHDVKGAVIGTIGGVKGKVGDVAGDVAGKVGDVAGVLKSGLKGLWGKK